MFLVGIVLVARKDFVPLIGRDRILIAGVVPDGAVRIVNLGFDFALRGADRLRDAFLHAFLLGHEFRIAAKQNIGAAPGHVGGDGDHAFASGLRDNLRFALVILRVQDDVFDSLLLQQVRKPLRLFDRSCAHQDRLAAVVQPLNFVGSREILFFFRTIDDVRILYAQQRSIGWNDDDFKPVYLVEFWRFGFGRARHARQLLIHAEIILEGDSGEGLILALDLHILLGFDRLVQPIRPAAAGHQAPGEFVHDQHFAVFDYVLDVALVKRVRFDGSFYVMLQRPVFRVGDVADAQQLLDFHPAVVADRDVAMFFVDHVVASHDFWLARLRIYFFALFELGDDAIDFVVLVGGLFAGARNNERGARFVDQDGIDFVDDREVMHALHAIAQVELHVVAQIVETEFVVGAVSHVRGVGGPALHVIKVVDDHAHRQAEEAVELAHPFGIALGQVIIDRNHVHAASAQRIQIYRKRRDQRLAFAGLHLSDLAFMQNHAADQLHVEVAHVEHAPSGFADDGKGFLQQFVENAFEHLVALLFDFFLTVAILEILEIGILEIGILEISLPEISVWGIGIGCGFVGDRA